MLNIVLLHRHYDDDHLAAVKNQMLKLGAPKIRCIWSEINGLWMAVEGCHRLRAALAIGITPVIINISNNINIKSMIITSCKSICIHI